MSHPVFLTNSHFGHMPFGSENQWSEFFNPESFELESDQFIPILWLMLFQENNVSWAKFTDLLDVDDERNQNDLIEYQQAFADHHYAYLVVDQAQALDNLEHNKTTFVNVFGSEYLAQFEHLKKLIQQHYPKYILLRTSGLPLYFDDASFLLEPLQQIKDYQLNPTELPAYLEQQKNEIDHFEDPNYFFYGLDHSVSTESTTPTSEALKQDVDDVHSEPLTNLMTHQTGTAVWICTAIVVVLTLAVWFSTHSVLYAFVIFILSALILGFISSKLPPQKK